MKTLLSINKEREENKLEEILGLGDMSEEEQQEFLNKVGTLVVESAVLKFMVSVLPEERVAFEEWLEAHSNEDNLFEAALEAHPIFAEILQAEAEAFRSEAKKLLGITD